MDDDELRSVLDAQPLPPRLLRPQISRPPSHIALPPPPTFALFSPSPDLSPPYHTAPSSPALPFYTPPTSPLDDPPAPLVAHPALHITIPTSLVQNTDDPFPSADLPIDLALDDDGLSTLEKIYLFSRSKASFHRVFITHALPDFLHQVTPQEAIEYVLPLLSGLAMDEDEQVKEALAAQLVALIWWFFTHCTITPDEPAPDHASSSALAAISVQAFTPILGTLLLSPNARVGGGARYAIVHLLSRLKAADDRETGKTVEINEDEDEEDWDTGSFDREAREMFRNEIIQQVVIGMGRLDADMEDPQVLTDEMEDGRWSERNAEGSIEVVTPGEQGNGEEGVSSPREMERARSESSKVKEPGTVNPYFPVLPSPLPFSVPSPASSAGSTPPSDTSSTSSSSPNYLPVHVSSRATPPPSPLAASTTSDSNSTLQPRFYNDTNETMRHMQATDISTPSNHTHLPPLGSPGAQTSTAAPPMPQSPSEDSWTAQDASSHTPLDRQQTNLAELRYPTTYDMRQDYTDTYGSEEGEDDEQAAVGRLSSMSLMAAVTASGSLGEEAQDAFVKEVVRVGQDSVYWVRREASFALGALAKVAPVEVVICSLLPLFEILRRDPVWHVRHSVLFALPAILLRISSNKRRALALDTMMALSADESPAVRFGVLEALGEVIYTFQQDKEGPPEELVQLFLGRRDDLRARDGEQPPSNEFVVERPHICAFNYPAVALTLGRERWPELREVYLEIARNRTMKVRRTLAASLGELAKIIGQEFAERDLVGVWWDAIRAEEEEVRMRAAESVEGLLTVLGSEVGDRIMRGLVAVWDEGVLKGWREREGIASGLVGLGREGREGGRVVVIGLLKRALEDSVAAVREAGVKALPQMWLYLSADPEAAVQLNADLQSLATSTIFRRRMTFIGCQQAIASHTTLPLDDPFWSNLAPLAHDPILGVRIALARLVASVSERLFADPERSTSALALALVAQLSEDPSPEVQSYILHPSRAAPRDSVPKRRALNLSTFSRPPPIPLPAALSLGPFANGIEELTRNFDGGTSALRTYDGSTTGRSDPDHPMNISPIVRPVQPLGASIVPETDSQHRRPPVNTLDFADTSAPLDDAVLHDAISTSQLMADTDVDVNPKSSIAPVPA